MKKSDLKINVWGEYVLLLISFITLLFSLCSCAEDQNENDTDVPEISYIMKGQFIDTYVQGLEYKTSTQNGITDSNGYFNYKMGEIVEFSIGNTKIGTCTAKQVVTPIDIVGAADINDIRVLNICRLLQSLDIDGNLDNGIQLNEIIVDETKIQIDFSMSETDFENNSEVNELFSTLNLMQVFTDSKTRILCSTEEAKNHFVKSLESVSNYPYSLIKTGLPMEKAMNVPTSVLTNMKNLVYFLIEDCKNDFEKAKVLHDWIALNIAYAFDMYQSNNFGPMDAESVFNRRTGVCEGYSNLFLEFCNIARVTCVKVHGKAKGYSGLEGHAWNSLYINNHWYLVDTTWDAGGINNDQFVFAYKNNYLFTDPRIYISNHLPNESKWQLLEKPISIDYFINLPDAKGHFGLIFEINEPLLEYPHKYSYNVEDEFYFSVKSDIDYSLYVTVKNDLEQTIDTSNLILSTIVGGYNDLRVKFPEAGSYDVSFNFWNNQSDSTSNFLGTISYKLFANTGASLLFPHISLSNNCNIIETIQPKEYNPDIEEEFHFNVKSDTDYSVSVTVKNEFEQTIDTSNLILSTIVGGYNDLRVKFPEAGSYDVSFNFWDNSSQSTSNFLGSISYKLSANIGASLLFPYMYFSNDCNIFETIELKEYNPDVYNTFQATVVSNKKNSNIWGIIKNESDDFFYENSGYILKIQKEDEYHFHFLFPETGSYRISVHGDIENESYTNNCFTALKYDINVLEVSNTIYPTIYGAYEKYKCYTIEPLEYKKNISSPFTIKIPKEGIPDCEVKILDEDNITIDTQNILETVNDNFFHIIRINLIAPGEYRIFIMISETEEWVLSYDVNYVL